MAANPKSPIASAAGYEHYHVYHAKAHILSGELEHPIKQPIEKYGRVVLENTRRESLVTQSVGPTNIEGLISFKSGHTRVVGTQIKEKFDILGDDHAGYVTLSTAVLEGYNVVDILMADRVVAQVSTEHPMVNGHVPKVMFLGSRFENLRIGEVEVKVHLNLEICGDRPERDRPYLEDGGFLERVETQIKSVRGTKGLPGKMREKYDKEIADIKKLKDCAKGRGTRNGISKLQCTLVESIDPIPIPGVKTFGNVIFIPNFGTVALAELEVGVGPSHSEFRRRQGDGPVPGSNDSNYFTLNMFDIKLGCPVGGGTGGPGVSSNGHTKP
jgi:hypothetical protein